jgi:hypothetical protein
MVVMESVGDGYGGDKLKVIWELRRNQDHLAVLNSRPNPTNPTVVLVLTHPPTHECRESSCLVNGGWSVRRTTLPTYVTSLSEPNVPQLCGPPPPVNWIALLLTVCSVK